MRKVLGILCIVGIFISLLSGCSGCNDKEYQVLAGNKTNNYENHVTEQTPVEDEIIINEVHVTEQPLSEIITEESDPFAKCYKFFSAVFSQQQRYLLRFSGKQRGILSLL